jgi:hypothetical protein
MWMKAGQISWDDAMPVRRWLTDEKKDQILDYLSQKRKRRKNLSLVANRKRKLF